MVRLTVGQAVVRFLSAQYSESDGEVRRFIAGTLGIFGHGNVAGLGQALLQDELGPRKMPYVLARNEQAMVHTAVGYAKQLDRLSTWACTASIGPGSTNMLTGAALATINRIPVLLLPSGTFATRVSAPVLQELELPYAADLSVNDAFRPLSRFYDQVDRPEQLPAALLGALRVLTDPAETGAATISLPQDVQAESYDWPEDLFTERVWHIARPPAEPALIETAARLIRSSERPLIVAGGGVHYSQAEGALADFVADTGIPVVETQAGKGSLLHGNPALMGAIGSTGTTAANTLAREADLVIGIGTRWGDFTTASRTAFANPDVQFININVAGFDAGKHSGLAVVADAREAIDQLCMAVRGWSVDRQYSRHASELWQQWDSQVDRAYKAVPGGPERLLSQAEVIGAVNSHSDPQDVVLCAAGSMPGDLHKLWRVRDRKGYHVEYGYSCMGYEIPAALGIRLADPDRDVFAMVGDGGYLMMPTELVTALQEGVKIIVVLVQNHGFGSIGALSDSLGSQRFGTSYRARGDDSGRLDGELLPVDLAANARSLGALVIEVDTHAELVRAIADAKAAPSAGAGARPVVIHVRTDPTIQAPDGGNWWDVPVSQESELDSTRAAYETYVENKARQRPLLRPTEIQEK